MVQVEIHEIQFDSQSFSFVFTARCQKCGQWSNNTFRMQRLTRFAVGCKTCESSPSFSEEIFPFVIDIVTGWGYEPTDIQRVADKLISYEIA